MKKNAMFLNGVMVAVVLGLTACSSGGGGSESNHTLVFQKDTVNQNHTPISVQNRLAVQPVSPQIAQEIQKAIDYTNQLRAEKKLPPVQYDASLSAYAQVRAKELLQKFDHTRPNGEIFYREMKGCCASENIAAGSNNAKDTVMGQWRTSQGHYDNIMGANHTKIGIGLVVEPNSKYGYYWAQILGGDSVSTDYFFEQ